MPRDDWCRVDSAMPTMTSGRVSRPQQADDRGRPGEPLEHHRRELQRQHRRVEHHAHGHLEERRVQVPVEHRAPDVPRAAEVHHQAEDDGQVAEEGGQDGGPHHGVIALPAEDVDGGGDDEAAGRQGHPAEDVEADPHAPGRRVAERGRDPEAEGEADHRHDRGHAHQEPEDGLRHDQAGVLARASRAHLVVAGGPATRGRRGGGLRGPLVPSPDDPVDAGHGRAHGQEGGGHGAQARWWRARAPRGREAPRARRRR